MAKILYTDKAAMNENSQIPDINKVKADDMNEIKSVVNTNTPIGLISMYAGSTAPTGWLICDGSAVSRTTYANLFNVIGITYGSGDGSTTFNLPNLKGRIPVGLDSNDTAFDILGEKGGEKTHTLTTQEMPSHSHGGLYWAGRAFSINNGNSGIKLTGQVWSEGDANANYWGTGNTGDGQAHNNLQPYIVLNYIISY